MCNALKKIGFIHTCTRPGSTRGACTTPLLRRTQGRAAASTPLRRTQQRSFTPNGRAKGKLHWINLSHISPSLPVLVRTGVCFGRMLWARGSRWPCFVPEVFGMIFKSYAPVTSDCPCRPFQGAFRFCGVMLKHHRACGNVRE